MTSLTFAQRRAHGVTALIVALLAALVVTGALFLALSSFFPALVATLLCGILASALLAQRSLDEHVRAVADALEKEGLDTARDAVSLIVGRDKTTLGEAGVGRAAVESWLRTSPMAWSLRCFGWCLPVFPEPRFIRPSTRPTA